MKTFILAIDQGTTSTRAVVFNKGGAIVASAQKELSQHYPKPGWVEHDAWEIWEDTRKVIDLAIREAGIDYENIAAIGITNQRETAVVWNRKTGRPICPAIVWQCRRTSDRVAAIGESDRSTIFEKTGLLPDAYFSATKLEWILDNVEGARAQAERGELLFGTIDCWLLYCLSGGKSHATDYTNASRTMLFNIRTLSWDDELLRYFRIPRAMLPEVLPCSGFFGTASVLPGNIPVCGMAGDQQAGLFGQGCFEEGQAKNTYGTGCFLLLNTGTRFEDMSANGLLTTIAMARNGTVTYALEGSVFIGGAVVQWLRDELHLIKTAAETESRALSVKDSGGVYVVPAFAGLGAPYWDMYARGAILGLTRGTGVDHIVRASLESIAYQVEDLLHTMRTALSIRSLKVDGGACVNDFLMQFQADVSDIEVVRPKIIETTVRGAAFLAGLAVRFWKSEKELLSLIEIDRTFNGNEAEESRRRKLDGWHKAVGRAKDWESHGEN